jgi:hypothetical protein
MQLCRLFFILFTELFFALPNNTPTRPSHVAMAQSAPDLSDEQIDQLLREAEVRLAAKKSTETRIAKRGDLPTPPTAQATKEEPAQTDDGLTVRIPRPAVKRKKVRGTSALSTTNFLPRLMMKTTILVNDAVRTARHGRSSRNQMISFFHSYSDRDNPPPFGNALGLVDGELTLFPAGRSR